MRNARKVTRRRSVKVGLPAALFACSRGVSRWMWRQQRRQHGSSSGALGERRQARRGRLLHPGSRLPGKPRARLRENSEGRRRQLQQLLRRLRRPEPRGRRRPARLGRPLRPGRRHGTAGRRRRARRQRLGQAALRRHRPGLGRRDHRPQGQSGGDQDPRRRADQGRRRGHPEPVQLRRGALEHHGRLRHRRSTRASPPTRRWTAVKTLLEKTVAQPGSARDALAAFTQGQGDVLLGYENEAIKAEDEGEDVEYVVPPSTILIETPIAVTKALRSRPRRTSSSSSGRTRARKSGPKTDTARSTRSWSTRSSSRPRRNCSRSASSVAGAKSTTISSTTKPARSPRSRRNSESRPPADGGAPGKRNISSSTPGTGMAPARGRRRHRRRHGHALSERDRAAAAGGRRQRSLRRRPRRLLGPGHLAAGGEEPETDGRSAR